MIKLLYGKAERMNRFEALASLNFIGWQGIVGMSLKMKRANIEYKFFGDFTELDDVINPNHKNLCL